MTTGPAKIVGVMVAVCAAVFLGACGFVVVAPLFFREGRIEPAGLQIEERVRMVPRSGIRRQAYEEVVSTGDLVDKAGRRVARVTLEEPVPKEGESVLYLPAFPAYHVKTSAYRYFDHLCVAAILGIAASALGYCCMRLTKDEKPNKAQPTSGLAPGRGST